MSVEVFQNPQLNPLNKEIWTTITDKGEPLIFGDKNERKYAKWLTSNIVFEGPALAAINRGEMPDGWEFKGSMVKGYCEQFDNKELWKGFVYTYAQRLMEYEIPNPDYPKSILSMLKYIALNWKLPSHIKKINQLEHMREQLKEAFETGIQSTRIIAIIYQPHLDYGQDDIPCFQIVQLLPLPGHKVEAHYLFRSHDYGNGYGPNMTMLNNAMIKHVITPAGGLLSKVVVTSWVAHLYDTDQSMIEKVVRA